MSIRYDENHQARAGAVGPLSPAAGVGGVQGDLGLVGDAAETLRKWVRQAKVDADEASGGARNSLTPKPNRQASAGLIHPLILGLMPSPVYEMWPAVRNRRTVHRLSALVTWPDTRARGAGSNPVVRMGVGRNRHPAAAFTAGLFTLTLMAMMLSVDPIAAVTMIGLAKHWQPEPTTNTAC